MKYEWKTAHFCEFSGFENRPFLYSCLQRTFLFSVSSNCFRKSCLMIFETSHAHYWSVVLLLIYLRLTMCDIVHMLVFVHWIMISRSPIQHLTTLDAANTRMLFMKWIHSSHHLRSTRIRCYFSYLSFDRFYRSL